MTGLEFPAACHILRPSQRQPSGSKSDSSGRFSLKRCAFAGRATLGEMLQLKVMAGAVRRNKTVSEIALTRPCSGRAELTPCSQRGGASILEPKVRGAKFRRLMRVRSWLKWLWTWRWREANFCRFRMLLKRSIARSRRRNCWRLFPAR